MECCWLLDEWDGCSRSSCSLKEVLRSESSRQDSRGVIGKGGCTFEVKDCHVRATAVFMLGKGISTKVLEVLEALKVQKALKVRHAVGCDARVRRSSHQAIW